MTKSEIVGRLYQTPVSVGVWHRRPTIGINSVWSLLYGSATASSGNVTVGVPSNLFSHRLRHSSSRRAGKRRRVARPMPNAKAPG